MSWAKCTSGAGIKKQASGQPGKANDSACCCTFPEGAAAPFGCWTVDTLAFTLDPRSVSFACGACPRPGLDNARFQVDHLGAHEISGFEYPDAAHVMIPFTSSNTFECTRQGLAPWSLVETHGIWVMAYEDAFVQVWATTVRNKLCSGCRPVSGTDDTYPSQQQFCDEGAYPNTFPDPQGARTEGGPPCPSWTIPGSEVGCH